MAKQVDPSSGSTPTQVDHGNASSREVAHWEDLDHTQTLHLGDSEATRIVYQKLTFDYAVLRSCPETEYTSEKKALVELSRTQSNMHLLSTAWVFSYKRRLHVGSELSDMSLADIIDCTISLEEIHVKTILHQVAQALRFLHACSERLGTSMRYASLRASNVFVSRNGTVKLASFGDKIAPEKLNIKNQHKDRWDLGALATHMISRSADEPSNDILNQKMISIPSVGRKLDANCKPSPQMVDFLEACFVEEGVDMGKLLKKWPPSIPDTSRIERGTDGIKAMLLL
ncbi:hypothetical protein F5882DRAFT_461552 [Hyaloscypha sp. PMI_1271]|nr:hypothetical protein F5882DRAFT_461552 [Hyaloscypha sp. PMI_1271]